MIERAKSRDASLIESLLGMAFGFSAERAAEYLAHVGLGAFFVVRRGSELIACAALLETRHRFGGNWVSAANIAHIAIAPEARGGGLAIPLVDALCCAAASRGAVMVTLFASARPVYRKCGFEVAGSEIVYEADTSAMPARTDLAFLRIAFEDPRLLDAYEARTLVEAGLLDRTKGHWREILRAPTEALQAYAAGAGPLSAYAIVDTSDATCLIIRDWYAATNTAATGLLAFFSRFRSVYPRVRWHGGPHDDLVSAMPDKSWRLAHHEEWLARILDPKAALETRGYLVREGSLRFSISEADGRRLNLFLEVVDGVAHVRKSSGGAAPSLALSAATFATLFTGYRSASRLWRQGLIETSAEGGRLADLVFSGPAPWLAEHV